MRSSESLEIVEVSPDTTAPVISGPGDISVEADGPTGSVVSFTPTATDDIDGPVSVSASPASGSTFAIGHTSVELSASDAARNTATASFTVTVQDTIAPVVTAPASIVAEATSAAGAADFTVTVVDTTAPAFTSVSGNLTIEATSAAGATVVYNAATATDAVGVASITYSTASGATFSLGTTTVTVTATDAAGNSSQATFTVTVRDTTAPAIASVTPSQGALWPPNHQMVGITLNAVATDAVGVTSTKIVNVTSSEPDNGLGDGDTAGDIVITGALSVNLRAERAGKGGGRTYTITVESRDAAGNVSTKTCTVSVAKSQGR